MRARSTTSAGTPRRVAEVRPLPFAGDDRALVDGLRAGQPSAIAAFCDRYSAHVLRVLARILGADGELADLHHDVFVRALRSVSEIEDPGTLKGWITIISVNIARTAIKRRAVRRWLRFLPWDELPQVEAAHVSVDDVRALRRVYALVEKLPADERIAFALRVLDGMELTDVADACAVSLATVKRRLKRAEHRFLALAQREPALADWLGRSARWRDE